MISEHMNLLKIHESKGRVQEIDKLQQNILPGPVRNNNKKLKQEAHRETTHINRLFIPI